jgi:hypothetical protein
MSLARREGTPVSEKLCSRCQNEPADPGQRWGRMCFNAAKRARRAGRMLSQRGGASQAPALPPVGEKESRPTTTATTNGGTTRNAIAPDWIYEAPERFVPFRDAPGHGPEWAAVFLADYSVHGGAPLAAARAGVSMRTVEGQRANDTIFAEEMRRALEYHRSLLEWESLNLGRCKHSPLPYFDRLKAELPDRHVDRALIATVNVTTEVPPDLGADFLREMIAQATPATRAILEGRTAVMLPDECEPK